MITSTLPPLSNLQNIFFQVETTQQYVRTTELSVFQVFSIPPEETRDFLNALEIIDKKYSQTVNINSFSKFYCGNFAHTFTVIYEAFHNLYYPQIKISVYDLLDKNDDNIKEKNNQIENKKKISRKNPTYVKFICFLFFFMSVPDQEQSRWVYWVLYDMPKKSVKVDNLILFCNSLWEKKSGMSICFLVYKFFCMLYVAIFNRYICHVSDPYMYI